MRHQDIRVGDTLRLKPNNSYDMGPKRVYVAKIVERQGYTVPWIFSDENEAFKPSDFDKRV
jgi:hypothetical protein